MDSFRMGGAWSLGYRLIAERPFGHAIILIGIGIAVPFLLQYAIVGESLASMNPALLGQRGVGTGLAAGAALLIAMAISYVLQTGSYFMSWRLGFGGERSLARPVVYGLIAGLLAVALFAAIGALAALVARGAASSGGIFLAALIFLIPLLIVFALFYTVLTAMIAAAVSLLLIGAMVFGAATGQVGLAATLVGGSGGVVVLALAMSAVLMWLAARLSCVAAVMADRRTFNPIAAIGESWRLTWEEQWAILRYLALIGFGLALVIFGAAIAVGMSATAFLQEQAGPSLQAGAVALKLAGAVPLAFLTVLVPAGIYRELIGSTVAAEVFA